MSIWRNKVPLRMASFAWLAALGKILIMDNLKKRHIIGVDWCCICRKSVEAVDHLLLYCEISSALLNTIFTLGMAWIMHG